MTGERSFTYNKGIRNVFMEKNFQKIEKKIRDFYESFQRMPSFSELGQITGLRSKNSVSRLVSRLTKDGFIKKDKKGKIIPNENWNGIRMFGLVEAGFPSPADEDQSDVISLDDFLIEDKDSSFILKVKGDSMIEAGIHDGDLVIAQRGREAKIGDIVVADVDGGWTMKYLRKKSGKLYLEPANKNYRDIYPEGELCIGAVVKAVVRKY